jgi:hypothetical protein
MYLKELIEKLKLRLDNYSLDELKSSILDYAERLPPGERQSFLDIFVPLKKAKPEKPIQTDKDYLIREIEEYEKRVADYEYTNGWGWDHDYGDERAWGDDSWTPEIDGLFGRVDNFYEAADYSFARRAYKLLLDIYYTGIEEARFSGYEHEEMMDTDIHETTLKYFRCLYMTEKMSSRPGVIFNAATWASSYTYNFSLQGMMNVSLGDLPEWEKFGELWTAFLKQQKSSDVVDRLLREAVRLFEGTKGLEKLATQKGHEFPEAYTDWLEALKKGGNTEEVLRAALLGLEKLPDHLFIRAKIADYLQETAVKLKRNDLILISRREALFAAPSLSRLLDFLDCSQNIDQRINFLNETLVRFDAIKKRRMGSREHTFDIHRPAGLLDNKIQNILELSAFLLKGDYARVAAFVKRAKPLGWTFMSNPVALAVPFFLYVCWDTKKALTFNMDQLWTRSTELQSSHYEYIQGEDTETNTGIRFRSYIKDTLEKFPIDEHNKMEYFSMAEKSAKKRIDAIVSGKHRKSYWKAAELLLAIAEVYWSHGESGKGQSLIDNFKKKYNRHSAFQRELKTAVKESRLFSI